MTTPTEVILTYLRRAGAGIAPDFLREVIKVMSEFQNGLCFYCEEPLAGELIHVDHLRPLRAKARARSLLCFHVSRCCSGQAGSCVARLGLLGRRTSRSGDTKGARHVLPRTCALQCLLVCVGAGRAPDLPNRRRTAGGHTREENRADPDRQPKTPSRGRVGPRYHRDTHANAATTAWVSIGRSHDKTGRVWCCAWRLRPGGRPSLQRCVSTTP